MHIARHACGHHGLAIDRLTNRRVRQHRHYALRSPRYQMFFGGADLIKMPEPADLALRRHQHIDIQTGRRLPRISGLHNQIDRFDAVTLERKLQVIEGKTIILVGRIQLARIRFRHRSVCQLNRRIEILETHGRNIGRQRFGQ